MNKKTFSHAGEKGFSLIDVGHGPSEAVALEALAGLMRECKKDGEPLLEVEVFHEDDPFSWIVDNAG